MLKWLDEIWCASCWVIVKWFFGVTLGLCVFWIIWKSENTPGWETRMLSNLECAWQEQIKALKQTDWHELIKLNSPGVKGL